MLLTITTTHQPATDLSFLLHKHPDKLQSVEIAAGKAHIFYPEANERRCTVAVLLDIDPIALVRSTRNMPGDFALGHFVNDRPYVASSFMSVALSKAFSTAMNGRCNKKPELPKVSMSLEIKIAVLPAPKGGELLIRKLFEPLDYEVALQRHNLDKKFSDWGESKYYTVQLKTQKTLQELLRHLYVLIPVLDADKHYWISQAEVEKLLAKGEGWLQNHPEKEQIVKRYLKNLSGFTHHALNRLLNTEGTEGENEISDDIENDLSDKQKETLHQKRLQQVVTELKSAGARRVIDLGCGEGKLLRLLLKEKQFEYMLGVDVAYRELEKAAERLHMAEMSPKQKERISLVQGSLTYRDNRLAGYDAAAIVEVIEHLDINRLKSFERVVFEHAQPKVVVLTTPNSEYNALFDRLAADTFRHADHRFEWTRNEFESWAKKVAGQFQYNVNFKPVGEEEPNVGAPSQMAVFTLKGENI